MVTILNLMKDRDKDQYWRLFHEEDPDKKSTNFYKHDLVPSCVIPGPRFVSEDG